MAASILRPPSRSCTGSPTPSPRFVANRNRPAFQREWLAGPTLVGLIGFFEPAQRAFSVIPAFQQGLGVPFTAVGRKKVAPIDMDRAGQAPDRICHGMNDVVTERLRVAHAKRSRAGRFDTFMIVRQATP